MDQAVVKLRRRQRVRQRLDGFSGRPGLNCREVVQLVPELDRVSQFPGYHVAQPVMMFSEHKRPRLAESFSVAIKDCIAGVRGSQRKMVCRYRQVSARSQTD